MRSSPVNRITQPATNSTSGIPYRIPQRTRGRADMLPMVGDTRLLQWINPRATSVLASLLRPGSQLRDHPAVERIRVGDSLPGGAWRDGGHGQPEALDL